MTIKRGPAYTYKATTDKTIHLSFSAEADPRRWRVTIWRKRRGTVPVVVWAKVYKRKASADRAARDYPRRFAAELARTGRCHSRKPLSDNNNSGEGRRRTT